MRSTSPPLHTSALLLPFSLSPSISPSLAASLCQKWPHSCWAVLAAVSEGLGARCMQCQYDHSQCKLHPQSLASLSHTQANKACREKNQPWKALTDAACANTGPRFTSTLLHSSEPLKESGYGKSKFFLFSPTNFRPHFRLFLNLHSELCSTALRH